MSDSSINIIGAGAIGHLWFTYLSKKNNRVKLYSRTEKSPKKVETTLDDKSFHTLIKYQTIDKWEPCDLILICVKAYQLESLCSNLRNVLESKTPIILMMNGLGLVELSRKYFSDSPIYHAFLTHGAYIKDEKLVHAGLGTASIGNLSVECTKDLIAQQIITLNEALPPVTWSTTHQQDMHIKLVINAVINPLTALSGKSNGSVLTKGQLTPVAEELFKEILLLKEALSLNLSDKKLKEMIEEVAIKTANNRSSMLQDISNKKPTEIDYINGYLLKQAKAQGFDLPLNSKLVSQIKALEASYIKK